MRKDLAKWLLNTSMNPKTTLVLTVSWVVLLLTLHAFIPSRAIEARIISPVLFEFRKLLDRDPPFHPKIKVFVVDDVTVNFLKGNELNLNQWATALNAIDSKNPKAIIIDALFGNLDTEGQEAQQDLDRLRALKTPIFTGAFPAASEIYGRFALPLNESDFSFSRYSSTEAPALPDFTSQVIYGPSKVLSEFFKRTGHILYGDDEGSFYPLLRLKDSKVMPHLMLMPFQKRELNGSSIFIEEAEFNLSSDGRVPINFSQPGSYHSQVKPLVHLLNKDWEKVALDQIEEGDYVYLVPMFFTGNTDFKPSPVGLIPGAYSHLAVLNSILNKNTIRYVDAEVPMLIVFAFLLMLSAWFLSPFSLIVSLVGLSLAWIAVCLGLFAYKGLILPFLLPQLSLLTVGLSLLMQGLEIADRRARMIRQTLEGFVSPEVLVQLQKEPEKLSLSLDARERILTVMFIDIVGFSLIVEKQMPKEAFDGLQVVIKEISQIIHKHGGIVNKTLGDGLLCFFGHSIEKNKAVTNHALEAVGAAFEIQQSNVSQMLLASGSQGLSYPLRIGINTGAVFMGNLGSGERVDITVVGNGVNFAKRLESACGAHSVLVGRTTHELLGQRNEFGEAQMKLITIKHHEKTVESWEYDPFYETPEVRGMAERVFEGKIGISLKTDKL